MPSNVDKPQDRLRDSLTLLKQIADKSLDAANLNTEERRKVLDLLDGPYSVKTGNVYTQVELATLLKVSRNTINRDIKILRRQRGHLVTQSDMIDAAGELRRAKRIAQWAARKDGDYPAFWQIELSYLQALQRLGIIREVPAELLVNGKVSVAHKHAFQTYDADTTAGLFRIARADRGRLIASNIPHGRN